MRVVNRECIEDDDGFDNTLGPSTEDPLSVEMGLLPITCRSLDTRIELLTVPCSREVVLVVRDIRPVMLNPRRIDLL